MLAPRKIIVLVGPKGSGKTFIGTLVSEQLGCRFLRVEPIFLENMARSRLTGMALDEEGYACVLAAVASELSAASCLIIESTGASEAFPAFLGELRSRYEVVLVSIRAPLEVCLQRVRDRDQAKHIPVSDDRVLEINTRASRLQLAWDLELENGQPASPAAIVERIRGLVS
jgi:shikimate kinase